MLFSYGLFGTGLNLCGLDCLFSYTCIKTYRSSSINIIDLLFDLLFDFCLTLVITKQNTIIDTRYQ